MGLDQQGDFSAAQDKSLNPVCFHAFHDFKEVISHLHIKISFYHLIHDGTMDIFPVLIIRNNYLYIFCF